MPKRAQRQRAGPGEAVSWPRKSTMNQIWLCVYAQLCLTLCNPMDCSPPGSFVHGILQWEYWSGLPFPTPGDLPNPGIESMCLMSPALAGRFFTPVPSGKPKLWLLPHKRPRLRGYEMELGSNLCLSHPLQLFPPPCLGGQIQPLIVQRFSLGWGWGLIRKPWVWVYKGGVVLVWGYTPRKCIWEVIREGNGWKTPYTKWSTQIQIQERAQ